MIGRSSKLVVSVVPRVLGNGRVAVSSRNFSNKSSSAPKSEVITPKSEFSGRTEFVIEHEPTVKKEALSRVKHNVTPGTEDAPWTPKSFIGKTPMESIKLLKGISTTND